MVCEECGYYNEYGDEAVGPFHYGMMVFCKRMKCVIPGCVKKIACPKFETKYEIKEWNPKNSKCWICEYGEMGQHIFQKMK